MKKLQSSLTNMVVVLVGVALITGCLLAYVNHITTAPKEEQKARTLADGISAVMGGGQVEVTANYPVKQTDNGKEVQLVIHRIAGGGAAVESPTMGFGGELRILVGFTPEGAISGYTVLQSAETPGLGAKAATWFQQGAKGNIIGKNPATPLKVSKDGGDVDAITASTITSRAFLKAVNQAYAAYAGASADGHTGATAKAKKG
ncbi:MAG: RnfABCDGE type electron transport complex subunit G [Prevotellaceae bacterium]|nr:RnfABCDGE type electron transport complex subunit G [Prevotella sp.]MDD7606364.1 RnfABCDGE type electron transport complex subunit G [Prevotellaceae bacterium]